MQIKKYIATWLVNNFPCKVAGYLYTQLASYRDVAMEKFNVQHAAAIWKLSYV